MHSDTEVSELVNSLLIATKLVIGKVALDETS